MKFKLKSLAAATLLSIAATAPWAAQAQTGKWVTGYYGGWFAGSTMYQKPEHVDMTAMTHFVFGRIGPGGGGQGNPGDVILGGGDSQTDIDHGPGVPWEKTVEDYLVMRAHQVGTKALIMLGGENENAAFHASCLPGVRATFVKNLVDYMVKHDYDGIDVDWEGIDSKDTENQALLEALIKDLRLEANARPRYQDKPVIITFPGGVLNPNYEKVSDHVKRLAALVDQYNIMNYTGTWFNYGWESSTFAPLTTATSKARPTSVASTIQMLEDAGVPRSKVGMGIGFYGLNYKPPFVKPGQPTDGYPMSDFSFTDTVWSWTLLNKLGYLDNGTYVWENETQTSYRTYPGGYTPAARTDTTSGYISYEEPATIAAKGAWALSNRPGEGAAGTIIWLVNYGTTDGVNNPLLTATKKAFLDPNATEPGPNPNPLDPPPPPVITAQKTITSDWGTGYCADMVLTNTGPSAGPWTYTETLADTVTSLWNGTWSQSNGQLSVSGPSYSQNLHIGQSTKVGFCATRPAKPVETPPPPPPGALTSTVKITADWTSGYCANIAVTNTTSSKVYSWAVDVPNIQGTITSLWSGKYTMNGTTMHLSGPDWNKDLAAGATNSDVGYCATR
ncbi:glycosyl hydrolase family 18 protein [Massilia agilis]|uniref:chitinase n=1 Tax=Massilia agilis TaxID=1811226 RepID=A0ABT2D8S0_9BURK|nr:glycosyl hydrolase family 18 protein [Massilia agilis]MCS0807695.1 glycosyl hydrolase family 18 protein [Massilia agilis]